MEFFQERKECYLPTDIQKNILEAATGEIQTPEGAHTSDPRYLLYLQQRVHETRVNDDNVRRWHNQVEVCDWSIFGESCADCPVILALARVDDKLAVNNKRII